MAYHLTGMKAYVAAAQGKLTPVKSGLSRKLEKDFRFVDIRTQKGVTLHEGTEYMVTGTSDGNGYVFTVNEGATYYLSADDGWSLC